MADFTPPPEDIKDWKDRSESLETPIDAASIKDLEQRHAADTRAVASAAVEHIEGQIPDLISDAVSEAVIDGAEDAVDTAVAGLSLVKTTDPGAPTTFETPSPYVEVDVDRLHRMTRGVKPDGTQHLPKAQIDALNGGVPALRSDPGMATEGNLAAPGSQTPMLEAVTDGAGRLSHGVLADGRPIFPSAWIAGARLDEVAVGGLGGGSVDRNGRASEDHYGDDGNKPDWVLNRWKTRMAALPGTVPPLDILTDGGQSNTVNADSLPADVEDEEVDSRIWVWTGTAWTPLVSIPSSERLVVAFAREYARKRLLPGRGVGVVYNGVGSSGFSTTNITPVPGGAPSYMVYGGAPQVGTWDRTLGSEISSVNLYNDMVARDLAAIAAAPAGSKFVCKIWSQGEADTGMPDTTIYRAKLIDLFSSWRTAVSAPATCRIVIGSMNPNWVDGFASGSGVRQIDAIHRDMPRVVALSAFFAGPDNFPDPINNDASPGSGVHWSSQGQRHRGVLALAAFDRARFNLPSVEPLPPHYPTAKRSGPHVFVSWDHPESHVDAFQLERRIDGGAWSSVALPATHTYDIRIDNAVTATQSISFRMRTTNSVGTSHYTREFFA